MILHQPVKYAEVVARDALRGFGLGRRDGSAGYRRWLFRPGFPIERGTFRSLRRYGYARGEARPRLTRFLRSYQGIFSTPGPLLAACAVVALVAMLGVGRARRSGLRAATLLLTALALTIYVGAVATTLFTWRYRLPLVVLLPAAAALAVTALLSGPLRDGDSDGTRARPSRRAGRRPSPRQP